MAKSQAALRDLVGKLLAEYAEFQRRRPDLPQGDLLDLSEEELEIRADLCFAQLSGLVFEGENDHVP